MAIVKTEFLAMEVIKTGLTEYLQLLSEATWAGSEPHFCNMKECYIDNKNNLLVSSLSLNLYYPKALEATTTL